MVNGGIFGLDHGLLHGDDEQLLVDGGVAAAFPGIHDGIWSHAGWQEIPKLQHDLANLPELSHLIQSLGRRPAAKTLPVGNGLLSTAPSERVRGWILPLFPLIVRVGIQWYSRSFGADSKDFSSTHASYRLDHVYSKLRLYLYLGCGFKYEAGGAGKYQYYYWCQTIGRLRPSTRFSKIEVIFQKLK
jgi:hypothetical protein